MRNALNYLGQGVAYLGIAVLFGLLSIWPPYQHFPPDQAQITLSFAHGAKPSTECRRRTAEEIAELPPNMRRPFDCPRERLPVTILLEVDGEIVVDRQLPPTGLSGDGPSRIYAKFPMNPGPHRIVAKLRDTNRTDGYDYVREGTVELAPREILVIDFKADRGGFQFF